MNVFLFGAPIPQHADGVLVSRIAGDHGAAFSISAQILPRIEAEATHVADAAHTPALVLRAVRLGGILDHDQVVPPRDLHDGVHIGGLAVEVHWNNGFGARRDRALELRYVHRK